MRLFNVTLIIILVYFGYFLTVSISHGTYGANNTLCGPFPSSGSSNASVIQAVESTLILSQIWQYFITYSPVFWIILLLCIAKIFFLRNESILLKEFLNDKQIETDHQIEELQKINARLLKQNELNKKLD